MDADTNQLMEALKKCFRNETVNEIINFHGNLSQRLQPSCDQPKSSHIPVDPVKKDFIDSISVSYRFKQFYLRALSKLNLCTSNKSHNNTKIVSTKAHTRVFTGLVNSCAIKQKLLINIYQIMLIREQKMIRLPSALGWCIQKRQPTT